MDPEAFERTSAAIRRFSESMAAVAETVVPALVRISDVTLTIAGSVLVVETELDLWMRDTLEIDTDLLSLFD
jgi:hypothetical protein